MKLHRVRVYKSREALAREDQLAWKIAAVARDPVAVEAEVAHPVRLTVSDQRGIFDFGRG